MQSFLGQKNISFYADSFAEELGLMPIERFYTGGILKRYKASTGTWVKCNLANYNGTTFVHKLLNRWDSNTSTWKPVDTTGN